MITLTTDFGLTDHYVGVMKGVILSLAQESCLVDLCHQIPPQDVARACALLQAAVGYFPPQTIHLIVVDPGVGTTRRALYVAARRHHFLAPDNGVLSFLREDEIESVRDLSRCPWRLPQRSATFHGRDLFAPAAAYLAEAGALENLGNEIAPHTLERLALSSPQWQGNQLLGCVVYIDHFGNLITNVAQAMLPEEQRSCLIIALGEKEIHGLVTSYGWGQKGEMVTLINSEGYLEIAQNCASAAQTMAAWVGMPVIVSKGLK